MKTTQWIVAVMGVALVPMMGLAGFAQAPTGQAATQTADQADAAASQVPADQQPTKEQLAKLFEVMRLRQQFSSLIKMLPAMVQQQMHVQMKEMLAQMPGGKQPTPEEQAALDKLMAKYMEKSLTIYPPEEMINDATTVYQRHMTRTDVDAFIAFYSSPAGQHLLDAQPVIMKEYMPMVMQRIQSRSRELYVEMAKDIQDYVKTVAPQGASESSKPAKTPASK